MSEAVEITLPDGSVREVKPGSNGLDLAQSIGRKLGKDAVGVLVEGELRDLRFPLTEDASVRILTRSDDGGLEVLRHSMAHAMAQALTRVFPDVDLAIGPTIEEGYYYDVGLDHSLTPEDIQRIEKEIAKVVKENLEIERFVLSREEALNWAQKNKQKFKEEIISDLPEGEEISFYRQGDFTDLCSGPHLMRTGQLGRAFKVLKVAGAYWRGDENRDVLQRLYGTAFFDQQELDAYLHRLEEAKKRDHRRIGKDLDLFSFHSEAPSMPFFHPKGARVYNALIEHVRGVYQSEGYEEVITPQILDVELWKKSGHYDNYVDNMYFTRFESDASKEHAASERESAVKPMNCPTHCLIYSTRKRSYRDLPLRYADFGRLHRYERSGVTSGLFRVRSFSQDDAHIFCTPEQIEAEVTSVVRTFQECYRKFGFEEVVIKLATRPEKAQGSKEVWDRAEIALKSALDQMDVDYELEAGEGAFYGPKIDFAVRDALRRLWQLGTCQLDFSIPERFDLRYTASSGVEECPVMIHRAMLGSLERFLGVLIEHSAGDLPFWLAPVHVRVLSITDGQIGRVREVVESLKAEGIRVEEDVRNEKMGLKIRDASLAKVRYQLIIGARELEQGTVAVRDRIEGDLGPMSMEALLSLLRERLAD